MNIPKPRVVLWLMTLLLPVGIIYNDYYMQYQIFAPIWSSFIFSLDPTNIIPSLLSGIIFAFPIILAAIILDLFSRGTGQRVIVGILVIVAQVAQVVFLILLSMSSFGQTIIPLPLVSVVHFIIFAQFSRESKETPKVIPIPDEAIAEPADLDMSYRLSRGEYSIILWIVTLFMIPLYWTAYLEMGIINPTAFNFAILSSIPVIIAATIIQLYFFIPDRKKIAGSLWLFGTVAAVYLDIMITIQYLGGVLMLAISVVQFLLFWQFSRESAVEAKPDVEPLVAAPEVESETTIAEEGVQVLRGCAAVGGTFEYKVKVQNNTKFVINKITVSIVSYPEDCMQVEGEPTKRITMIEPNGFRSPLFTFTPTKDCVEGQIQASVSYVDQENELQVLRVEPYVIRSVCDLLEPLESSLEEFEALLYDMSTNSEEVTLPRNPQQVFSDVMTFLPERNFELISTESGDVEGEFRGTVRGLAEGKYTRKRVAVRIIITGPVSAANTKLLVEALGDDPDMLPTTIEEIVEGIKGSPT